MFSVYYDVNIHELNLKYNAILLTIVAILGTYVNFKYKINKIIKELILLERPLTCNLDYSCFYSKSQDLKINNIIKQEIILISNNKTIFWLTEIKNLVIKSIKQSKLGNPVFLKYRRKDIRNYIILTIFKALKHVRILWLNNKSIIGQLINRVFRGQDWHQDNNNNNNNKNYPNCHAYNFCYQTSKRLQNRNIFRSYTTNHKPLKNENLTQEVNKTISQQEWITTSMRQSLIVFIENAQKSIAETTLKYGMHSKHVNYLTESYLHTLLFQVYAIEVLNKSHGSKIPGTDNIVLMNNSESKIFLLDKLKKFYTLGKVPGIRISIPKSNLAELRPITIPSIIDRGAQQLFLLILDPIIECNSDKYSFGFRKGHNQIMAIGTIQKKLQSKPRDGQINLVDYPYIWDADIIKCFDSINHKWLLDNLPIPYKYKTTFNKWLTAGYIEYGKSDINETNKGIPQGSIISPLLMNFTLNGMEAIVKQTVVEYKSSINYSSIRDKGHDIISLSVRMISNVDNKFKEVRISSDIVRFADDFIVISGSPILLDMIKKNIKDFLSKRGLEIHPNKSRTFRFGINQPFEFLGYTFTYLIHTRHIKNKFLMSTVPEYRLMGRPRLYVYPSSIKYKLFKKKIIDILRSSYNITVFQLIAILNPIVRGWVNYYSFSNSGGTLTSLRNFLFNRLKIFLIKKHKKASIIWLMKHYFLLSYIKTHHNLDIGYISHINPYILRNKWNLYGIAFKDDKGNLYKKPKLNILLWPNIINKLVTSTIFAPSAALLSSNYYINKEEWINQGNKLLKHHANLKTSLFDSLLK